MSNDQSKSIMKILTLLLITVPLFLNGQSKVEKAKALYENKKYEEASKLLKGVLKNDKDYAAAQYYLGRLSYDAKKYDDAVDYFEKATEANNKIAEYFNWLGDTYGTIAQNANMVRQGFLAPKMKNAWETAVALDPKNINARLSLIEYYLQAPSFMGGSVDKAKEVGRQIIKLDPAQGYRSMGNIFAREKNFAEAEKSFLEMVKADDSFAPVLGNFYVSQQLYDKAFTFFEEAIQKNPNDMSSVYQFGRASAISGKQLDKGEKYLRQYLAYQPQKNQPSHAGANMRLAQIQEKRGNKTEAKKLYETALHQDNTLKEAKEGLQRVSK
jgi:tetratricopeptide (TPR) repeat protein